MQPFRIENIELIKMLKGWSYSYIAEVSGIPLRRLENIRGGYTDFTEEDAQCIAIATGFPLNFFLIEYRTLATADLTFRTTTRTPKKVINRLSAEFSILVATANRIAEGEKLPMIADGLVEELSPDYEPTVDQGSIETPDIEQLAVDTREMLGESSDGPLDNVTWALERAGFVTAPVMAMSDAPDDNRQHMDGVSHPGAGVQVIGFAKQEFGDRQRMTLSHELGHLILHRKRSPFSRAAREAEAFAFASAFLMPKADAMRVLRPSMNLLDFRQIKAEWGMSISSLIMRASRLGIIDSNRKRSLLMQLSARGWHRREPVRVELERPVAFKQILGKKFGNVSDAEKAEVYWEDAANVTGIPFSILEYWASGLEKMNVPSMFLDVENLKI